MSYAYLVIFHCQQDVARSDAMLLIVTAGIARQLKDFSAEILQDSREVHCRAVANSLSIVAFPQQPVDAPHWESDPCSGRPGHGRFLFGHSFLPTARHLKPVGRNTSVQIT